MRITRLEIKNFRAITSLKLTDLGDVVVIAGPNGSGKSCIFDAIRLLKSAYGGYQDNEWQQWFNEFLLNWNQRSANISSIFQDPNKPIEINAEFLFTDQEKQHILHELASLSGSQQKKLISEYTTNQIRENNQNWDSFTSPQNPQYLFSTTSLSLATPFYENNQQLLDSNLVKVSYFENELNQNYYAGSIKLWSDRKRELEILPSPVLSLVFSLYDPQKIGIIDYHSANRVYSREQVGGINLKTDSTENQLRQSALYNHTNKYSNLKTAIASSYLRQLIREKSGSSSNETDKITDTLKELFTTFFPGKEFLGPQPKSDGSISFDVKTFSGAIHDINELSSGEKEVLYGYLRLWNTAPKNSVLLIDEPELHLNPRLVSCLANFYHQHLGEPLGNQLWLVTHSDTLIREAVGVKNFQVFHLEPSSKLTCENQAIEVKANNDIERLIISLVGDLAIYHPGKKIVILEGGGDTDFDKRMVSKLFPEFAAKVNIISGSSNEQVKNAYKILEQAKQDGYIREKFYAITDGDLKILNSDKQSSNLTSNRHWDVYHIENYLLESRFILKVLQDMNAPSRDYSEEKIDEELKKLALNSITSLVKQKLYNYVYGLLTLKENNLGFNPSIQSLGSEFAKVVDRYYKRISQLAENELSSDKLIELEKQYHAKIIKSLEDDTWRKIVPGRDVLKLFTDKFVSSIDAKSSSVKYEIFRNFILARMSDANCQPVCMKKILDDIIAD
ncbi:AAA family ATPase [Anabaena cylindrica FACHB-243]|uniref:SMC domain protein n=1 Tax=Anabaena cylindrica (strain ATCC 27899 / PCC 7122) TaxID=272123 RepID=K9ZMN1_ANACC|nr:MULTISPECIES: ATP-binding protein [Anabaena]AFZ60461.1 SMC domain protein [Anabaena cylindrica PCC 7122]MBD2416447.1 AAA family ATPase [Anabaena cylindrica FACHB-243]MBY5284841.1 AAA family ATPase [Anabaena sp. CCAP 1446/1C]MBY5310375.1 AAA family ATPase [Anabaena sp. CCAP 1446/1C]MCM2408500.1 AAA family ATPase [Anabaena sp. CCAP 1446/1C]